MAHPIWKGSISFGLVNIPVELYSAEGAEEKLDFGFLDKHDLSPVGYKKFNKRTGKDVQAADLVKGYEYEEGRFVVLTSEDFIRANVKATQTVEIIDFVDPSDIHPVYYVKPYYLIPAARGHKSYALLREVLKKTGKAGIAKVVIHTREYTGAVIPYKDVLVLNILRYFYELRGLREFSIPGEDLPKLGVTDKELTMAEKLVEGMVAEWKPERHHDTYREELLAYIHKKITAGEVEKVEEALPAAEEVRARGEVIDLMALLKKSIEKAEGTRVKTKKTSHK